MLLLRLMFCFDRLSHCFTASAEFRQLKNVESIRDEEPRVRGPMRFSHIYSPSEDTGKETGGLCGKVFVVGSLCALKASPAAVSVWLAQYCDIQLPSMVGEMDLKEGDSRFLCQSVTSLKPEQRGIVSHLCRCMAAAWQNKFGKHRESRCALGLGILLLVTESCSIGGVE